MSKNSINYSSSTGSELTKGSIGAAAYDLKASENVIIFHGETRLVQTGIKLELPENIAGYVLSRSGLALKKGVFVLNAPGLIDSDYTGLVGVILHNSGKEPFAIEIGDRIAQLMFVQVQKLNISLVDSIRENTDRGSAGFGSTGVK